MRIINNVIYLRIVTLNQKSNIHFIYKAFIIQYRDSMSYWYGKSKIQSFIKQVRNKEVELVSAKSSWPWGQKVNKIQTKVQLIWYVSQTKYIPEPYLSKLIEKNKKYITQTWILRIDTSVHRTQKANKEQTYKKLIKIITSAFKEEKVRKKTKPPKRAVDKRIAEKKRKSKTRNSRKKIVW